MKPVFPGTAHIRYEGTGSKSPLAFKHYNGDEMVAGKTMREHLRFAVVYWHTFRGTGADPFGAGAKIENGRTSFRELEAYILKKGEVSPNVSGRQKFLENLINEFI